MKTQELKQYIDRVLGNSIRCLLPSYWWKRLFNQVADRIDEVEQSTSQLIDSKVEESKMPIVESVDELSKLDLPKGSVASVEKVGEPVVVNLEDCYLSGDAATDWDKYTVIRGFSEKGTPSNSVGQIHLYSDKSMENGLTIACGEGEYFYYKIVNGRRYYSSLEEVNEYLASGEYRLVFGYYIENISTYVTLYSAFPQPSLYIKGDSWERLAKESDVVGGSHEAVLFYMPLNDGLSDIQKQTNAESYRKVVEGFNNNRYYDVKVDCLYCIADATIVSNALLTEGRIALMFDILNTWQIMEVLEDGSATVEEEDAGKGCEIREFYTGDSLTDEQKAWNLETAQAILDKKAIVICNGSILGDGITTNNDGSKEFINSAPTPQGVLYAGVKVEEDGTASIFFRQLYLDDKLSDKSISAVQNKVITAALNTKADKTEIKTINGVSLLGGGNLQLGDGVSEDYVNTAIANAITTTLNTAV